MCIELCENSLTFLLNKSNHEKSKDQCRWLYKKSFLYYNELNLSVRLQ